MRHADTTLATGGGYSLPVFPYRRPAELDGKRQRHPVVVVGGGLSGLTAACDLAQRGIAVVLVDEDDTVGVRGASSRGIVYAQKTLEIFDRLGIPAHRRQGRRLVGGQGAGR
jgi:3-(3-hydroxy-phenyl)propionate hydroxylase